MPATAAFKQSPPHSITVITQKNLPAHLRQTQPYDSILSTESSPLLSPPPPYQQYEQASEYNVRSLNHNQLPSHIQTVAYTFLFQHIAPHTGSNEQLRSNDRTRFVTFVVVLLEHYHVILTNFT